MSFPSVRLRRLRSSPALRNLVRETQLRASDFALPLFVRSGRGERKPIASMPGHFQVSLDELPKELPEIKKLGIPAIILFGIPERKDERGSEAYSRNGVVQQAVRAIKDAHSDLLVITDLCFCEYTTHGHCGIMKTSQRSKFEARRAVSNARRKKIGLVETSNLERRTSNIWFLDNDATLELIAKTAVSQAESGADVIAPSGMMDGQVKTIRAALDQTGFQNTPILSYAAKYSSAFYGPFREAAQSPPQFGDRSGYQMDPSNVLEALREVSLDVEEGADMVLVKPALPYLDVLHRVKEKFGIPTGAYNVSGEYAMVKAAMEREWIDGKRMTLEILTSIKRAGADFIITYHAKEAARWLQEKL